MRLTVGPGDDPADLVRATAGESVVLVIDSDRSPIALAQAIAAVGPLAIDQAPARRVNAVVVTAGAAIADVDAAIAFLDQAASTTGQILTIA